MITEIALIDIIPGHEADFEAAVAAARPHFQAAQGALSLDLERSVENPSRYRLVVGWADVEAHTVAFRASEGFQAWRSLAGPYFAAPPHVEHTERVFKGF